MREDCITYYVPHKEARELGRHMLALGYAVGLVTGVAIGLVVWLFVHNMS